VKKVDLNVDIGEGFPHDEALLEFATSANVCCGEHAGCWDLTVATVAMCTLKGKRIGAHPGFPDRANFGRQYPSEEDAATWCDSVVTQCNRFKEQFSPSYIKPHGAWYNLEARRSCPIKKVPASVYSRTDSALMLAWDGCRLPFLIVPDSYGIKACTIFARDVRKESVSIIAEGFADRKYASDGSVVPRSNSDAVLSTADEIRAQVLFLAPSVDSICLHGDTPNCLEFAELVYKTLTDAAYEVGY
jgi:5-oxoprolinase (ATP-hydrolysing) subunit A